MPRTTDLLTHHLEQLRRRLGVASIRLDAGVSADRTHFELTAVDHDGEELTVKSTTLGRAARRLEAAHAASAVFDGEVALAG